MRSRSVPIGAHRCPAAPSGAHRRFRLLLVLRFRSVVHNARRRGCGQNSARTTPHASGSGDPLSADCRPVLPHKFPFSRFNFPLLLLSHFRTSALSSGARCLHVPDVSEGKLHLCSLPLSLWPSSFTMTDPGVFGGQRFFECFSLPPGGKRLFNGFVTPDGKGFFFFFVALDEKCSERSAAAPLRQASPAVISCLSSRSSRRAAINDGCPTCVFGSALMADR